MRKTLRVITAENGWIVELQDHDTYQVQTWVARHSGELEDLILDAIAEIKKPSTSLQEEK